MGVEELNNRSNFCELKKDYYNNKRFWLYSHGSKRVILTYFGWKKSTSKPLLQNYEYWHIG